MFQYVVRTVKRFIVLVPGLALTYVAIFKIYPDLNKRVPAAVAIFITYVVTAYGLIPAALRLIRIVVKPRHIPLYCTTPDGFASDPVNVGLVSSRTQITSAMEEAGWFLADKRSLKNLLGMGLALIFKQPYPNAPLSSLYLFGRRQDLAFELPVDNNPRHRHHVRFWLSEPTLTKSEKQDLQFWQQHGPAQAKKQKQLWVGAASLDTGLNLIRHNAQITHMIHPDTNAERDLIVKNLKDTGLVKNTRSITVGSPYQIRNRVWGGFLKADGKMTICEFKKFN